MKKRLKESQMMSNMYDENAELPDGAMLCLLQRMNEGSFKLTLSQLYR